MAHQDFSPTNCAKCGRGIWSGLGYAMMPTRLDATRLNLAGEIVAKLKGLRTYEAHRTAKSFEVTPRTLGYIGSHHPVVLAQHECQLMISFENPPTDLWGRDVAQNSTNTTEVPF